MHERPPDDRPRERLERDGPAGMTDEELLAIVLGTGGKGGDALDCARRLAELGDLRQLASRTVGELTKVPGLGRAKASRIKAALALATRLGERRYVRGDPLGHPALVHARFAPRLRLLEHEILWAVTLDVKLRVLVELELARGDRRSVVLSPSEAFGRILRESPAGVMFVHNHPSGDPSPSVEDRLLTQRLQDASDLLGIALVDHIIVAEDAYFSFRAEERNSGQDANVG